MTKEAEPDRLDGPGPEPAVEGTRKDGHGGHEAPGHQTPPVPGVPPGVPEEDHPGEGPATTTAAMDPG